MLAEVTEAINLLDVELVKRNFFKCRQYAVVVLGPLHIFEHFHLNRSASKRGTDRQRCIRSDTLRINSSVILVMKSYGSRIQSRSTRSEKDCYHFGTCRLVVVDASLRMSCVCELVSASTSGSTGAHRKVVSMTVSGAGTNCVNDPKSKLSLANDSAWCPYFPAALAGKSSCDLQL